MRNKQGTDECWPSTDKNTDALLWTEVNGCMTHTDNYCKCDTSRGWVMDPDGSQYCQPYALIEGQDDPTEECWLSTSNAANLKH